MAVFVINIRFLMLSNIRKVCRNAGHDVLPGEKWIFIGFLEMHKGRCALFFCLPSDQSGNF